MPDSKPTLRSGDRVKISTADDPHLFNIAHLNRLETLANALLNCPQIQFTENNATIRVGDPNVNHWRGEYLDTASYALYDVVFISTGANAGTYLCLISTIGSANPPWLGNGYWVKFPVNQTGQWG
jgi:hypothetical protein